jgi:hypothetical protein
MELDFSCQMGCTVCWDWAVPRCRMRPLRSVRCFVFVRSWCKWSGYGVDSWGIVVWLLAWGGTPQSALGPTQLPFQCVRGSFTGYKAAGARKWSFISSNAKINEWSCASFAPYAFVVCMGTTFTALCSLFLEPQLDIFSIKLCQLPVGWYWYFVGFSTSYSFSII